ncbi:type IV pili sensor histidine kinase and response regulator [Kosakonia radicincitans]|uniref:Type IV pili sensor histidine kinase and response regulator n=1 Tax=Kosakonia radicincitans TaxID=283686 RepID=A0AAX2EZD5_9ENTR|nr:TcpQ domain-containing protein [Kosakonia radicincitans]SFF37708.1 type IV pili sensor histidine kinase and response regulator [Kosakonia radicincitans]SFR26170.1 type IV pili sensor histidine kinase and response regulator [Kosakonia radicincitans]SFU16644.1 type IV pili sensor histidine kinase and response regulator [Kosakonia radicincitans]SFY31827.1 type IV pili sensor histidine kinase and response regulator [Kosakonia radicincitans]
MSFTERAGLFPVLLLTGCVQPAVITGPPSSSVVDSMLSRSAADISAMQYRVHQTGPSAQRPAPTASAKSGSPLLAHAASTSALTVKPAAMLPVSAASAGPADGFVRQDGAEPTLRAALRKIIPPGHTVVFDKAVFADTPQLWRWKGNDRWQYVANKMLAMRGLKATVNEKAHMVTVEPAQRAQTAHATTPAVSMPVPGAAPVKSVPAGAVKATSLPTIGRNPFRDGKESLVATSQTSALPKVVVKPLHAAVRIWKIERGTTLREGYEQWASQEVCPSDKPKWTVQWDTGTNYPIDYTLTFHASSFEDATVQLFNLWHRAQIPLFVNGYRQQCLVVISDVPPNAPPQSSPQE